LQGSKARTVGIDAGALALDQWLDKRAALGIRSGSLFCTFSKNASWRPHHLLGSLGAAGDRPIATQTSRSAGRDGLIPAP